MPNYKSIRPLLWTKNLEESIEFYLKVLDFQLKEKNEQWHWAEMAKDGVEIILAQPNTKNEHARTGISNSVYIVTDNIDQLWLDLKEKVKICYDLGDFEWDLREFAIHDNNGHVIQFGQNTGVII